ncbi:MAG: CoA-binding protein [Candidatus Alcyoniella australis]|nr:CoA-binding protein [Candidatus Alcyoniella australis]
MSAQTKQHVNQLDYFFKPRSVAVVGASSQIIKWGSFLMVNMVHGGYQGEIYPVNPKESEIIGRRCYASLLDIEGPVDLVLITVPAKAVGAVIEDCIAKGVPAVVMITSGFSETGDEGTGLEQRLMQRAREGGIRVIGPNTMGILSTEVKLYTSGAPVFPKNGGISMISQSGNLGTQMMAFAEEQGLGINKFIGTGNEGDVDTCELLDYLADDPSTSVIIMYMEGIDEGRRFLASAKRAASIKPVIVLKAGRTRAGQTAASSHTGAMSGSSEVFRAVVRQAGLVEARSPSEMIDLACAFAYLPLPSGDGVGVITLGGGWGVVTADECVETGLRLPELPDELIAQMDALLPPYWSRSNPIDLVGKLDLEVFTTAMRGMAKSGGFSSMIVLGVVGTDLIVDRSVKLGAKYSPQIDEQMAEFISQDMANREFVFLNDAYKLTKRTGIPIIPVSLSGGATKAYTIENGGKVVVFTTPEKAVLAIAKLYEYARFRARRQ